MVLGPFIGAGLGALAGVGIGSLVFSGDRPRDYEFITEAADKNDSIRTPAAANVTDEMRRIIPLTPEWTFWPDYDRWVMINRLIRVMWPKLTLAIIKQVIVVIKPMVQNIINALPSALAVLDDITLGHYSLMDAEHLDPHITDKYFSLGDHPVRVAGMKVYQTMEDTCIFETPIIWGSNMVFDIQVYLRLGSLRLVVPISLSHIQFKATSRIVLDMVDTVPCIGGATVTLLDVPHVDFRLSVFGGPDVMAMPGIKSATRFIISYVLQQLMLYPNSVSVPLMTNFGIPKEPQGMVHVTLHKIERLKTTDFMTKGDPYVVFEIREGRQQRSKTVKGSNNPTFNEEFFMVVDDFIKQKLSIKVYDYDRLCPTDDLLGTAEVYFSEEVIETDEHTGGQKIVYNLADWVKQPMLSKKLVIPLHMAGGGLLKAIGKTAKGAAIAAGKTATQLITMTSTSSAEPPNLTHIKVAKTVREVRLQKEKEAAAAAAKAAAAAAAATASAKAAAAAAAGQSSAAEDKLAAAASAVNNWSDEDEQALWAEWKRINDRKKATAAAEAKRRKALTKEQRAAEDAAKKAQEAAEKAKDEETVLQDEAVVLRGNGSVMPAGTKSVGDLYITLEYMPFEKPRFDDDIELKPVKSGLAAFVPFDPPPAREIFTNVNDFQKGLLTVTIFKAAALADPGAVTAPDPYVEMILVDCDRKRPSETQRSTVKYNDSSPRWIETFDFVMISAGSMLTLNVWNKVTMMDAVVSLKLSASRFQDSLLGKVQIPVADVARNGHLKDTWALQDAESGTIEMKLQWQNCYVDQFLD